MAATRWEAISPDLSRDTYELPASVGVYRARPPSSRPRAAAWSMRSRLRDDDVNVIWAGTDDGLIHVTRDGGKTWKNVTPPATHAVEQSLAA